MTGVRRNYYYCDRIVCRQYGSNALDHSAEKGHAQNIRMLVKELGADPNVFDTVSELLLLLCAHLFLSSVRSPL
jgi:hypothetical protein